MLTFLLLGYIICLVVLSDLPTLKMESYAELLTLKVRL